MQNTLLSPDATSILAALVLLTIAVLVSWWLLRVYRRTSYTVAQIPLYALNYVMTRVQWRTTVHGELHLRPGEGAIIICNHIGPIDPAFVALATTQPVHWFVAKEYFSYPIFGWALRALQAIPTNRAGIDTAATKIALRYLKNGELVGIFPEGKINRGDQLLLPGRGGAALLALKTRARVVPCYLRGSPYDGTSWGFLFMTARAHLTIGQPLDLSEYYDRTDAKRAMEEVTLLFMREIAKLAGQPDYPVEVINGRRARGVEESAPVAEEPIA